MESIISLDEKLARSISFSIKNRNLRRLLLIFEYFFHGVPWFLMSIIAYLYSNNELASKAAIVFVGNLIIYDLIKLSFNFWMCVVSSIKVWSLT
jgi:hypothetical protein